MVYRQSVNAEGKIVKIAAQFGFEAAQSRTFAKPLELGGWGIILRHSKRFAFRVYAFHV